MIHPPASVRVYLATSPCDMRRSFDGLHALVNAVLQLDAFAGHLFVFANRRRDRVKILYWDRDGFAVWAKRLEEGTYAMPFGEQTERRREITAQELGALLSGIDLSQAKRRKHSHQAHLEWTPSRMVHWAQSIGPNTARLFERIMNDKPHPEMGYRSCLGIIRLAGQYSPTRMEAASSPAPWRKRRAATGTRLCTPAPNRYFAT